MHKFIVDQITGKFSAVIAEFWFKFIGYVMIASVFYAADKYADSLIISACMWASYVALYFWLKFEFEKAMYYVWPELEPMPGGGQSYKDWQFITANTLAPMLTISAFGLGKELVSALAKLQP